MPHFIILGKTAYIGRHAMLIYLIRPRASLSCRLERWPLGIYFTEMVAEFFGEAFDDFRVTGAKVVLFADIVGDVEQLFLASAVIVNQFPVAIADRTVTKVYKKVGFLQI